ncbi:cytoskeleton-associated protein 2-like [Rhinatrema bivittatum]|uniref:cytoskeleton-associated protein 2-like n=1 Tax=Rhinatrema bivittatum TaxID=194408 RepID=UPI001126BFEC|nr:cytoskeleton-associated protein 2-like [Rhinatrema bivittatum]
MEGGVVVRKISAEEERRKKLLEYLAAKGKLKPQDSQSTKYYLRDVTNRQNARLPPVSKLAPIVKQKDKVPSKHAPAAVPARKAKPVNPALQSISNTTISQRLLGKAVPSVLSRPSSIGKLPSRKYSQQSGAIEQLKKTTLLNEKQVVRTKRQQTVGNRSDGMLTGTINHLQNQKLSTVVKSLQKKSFCVIETLPVVPTSKNKPKLEISTTVQTKIGSSNPGTKSNSVHRKTVGPTAKNPDPKYIHRNFANKTQVPAKVDKSKNIYQNPSRGKANGPSVSSCQTYTISRSLPSEKQIYPKSKTSLAKPGVQTQRPGPFQPGKTINIVKTERPNCSKDLPLKKQQSNPCVSKKPTVRTVSKSKATTDGTGSVPVKSQQSKGITVTKKNRLQETALTSEARARKTFHKQHTSIFRAQDCIAKADATRSFVTPKSVTSRMPIRKATTEIKAGPRTTGKKAEEERRKKLEEWLNSKGKTYKRPPMLLVPPKKPEKEKWVTPFWDGIEDDEEQQCLTDKIHHTLDECLKLIKEGYPSEQLSAILSRIPEGEKFAKFWICKAKLQERGGPFDVFGLYELAVRAGAGPIQELREVVFGILENTTTESKAVTFEPLPGEDIATVPKNAAASETTSEEFQPSYLTKKAQAVRTPGANLAKGWTAEQGSYLRLQVGEIPRLKGKPALQDLKLLTPVRRSIRIERSVSCYPEILQEHDTVVGSLNELLDLEETSSFVYRQNEALPKEINTQILGL